MAVSNPVLLFSKNISQLGDEIVSSKSVNINSARTKETAKDLVQEYFRVVSGYLTELEVDGKITTDLAERIQGLNKLASGNNAKTSYRSCLKGIKEILINLEVAIAAIEGQKKKKRQDAAVLLGKTDKAILSTLDSMLPTAHLSYYQAIVDLNQEDRRSFRGVASELREVLRELLDHMAPDIEVSKVPGFKLEQNMTKPSQRQKAKFILNSRKLPKNAQGAPMQMLQALDEIISGLARSVYERGSISTHVGATKKEVAQLKRYLDVVLCEFLQIS